MDKELIRLLATNVTEDGIVSYISSLTEEQQEVALLMLTERYTEESQSSTTEYQGQYKFIIPCSPRVGKRRVIKILENNFGMPAVVITSCQMVATRTRKSDRGIELVVTMFGRLHAEKFRAALAKENIAYRVEQM